MMFCGSYFMWSNLSLYELSYLYIYDPDNVNTSIPIAIDAITNVILAFF